jgi:hypothetical protein
VSSTAHGADAVPGGRSLAAALRVRSIEHGDGIDLDEQVGLAERADTEQGHRFDGIDTELRTGPTYPLAQRRQLLLAPVDDIQGEFGDVVEAAADCRQGRRDIQVGLFHLGGQVTGPNRRTLRRPRYLSGQVDGARPGRHRHLSVELRLGQTCRVQQFHGHVMSLSLDDGRVALPIHNRFM